VPAPAETTAVPTTVPAGSADEGVTPPTELVADTGGSPGGGGITWPPLWQTLVLLDVALLAMVAIGLYRRGLGV
jgi:hypothetical protein